MLYSKYSVHMDKKTVNFSFKQTLFSILHNQEQIIWQTLFYFTFFILHCLTFVKTIIKGLSLSNPVCICLNSIYK